MPLPTMATSRPPGGSILRASSTCFAPTSVFFVFVCAEFEKGGFITTTVGRGTVPLAIAGSSKAFRCSAL